MVDVSLWKDILPLCLGAIGAVLGIMNTWNAMNQQRVRLRVIPAFLLDLGGEPLGFSIEVINLSAFPLTLSEVGFQTGGTQRLVLTRYKTLDGSLLPRRLEPREAVSFMFGPGDFDVRRGQHLREAYVRTACGRKITGDSPALRQFSQILNEKT